MIRNNGIDNWLEVEETSPELHRRAMVAVCSEAKSVTEARELLLMLGLIDDPEPVEVQRVYVPQIGNQGRCLECGAHTAGSRKCDLPKGHARYGARGLCDACYKRLRRRECAS